MAIQLSDHFTYRKLLWFTLPSVVMMIFTSIYTVVDGIFVSNFVGKTPFAALNLIWPVVQVMGALGFMIGTGGSAPVVSYHYGAQNHTELQSLFRKSLTATAVCGGVMMVTGLLLAEPLSGIFVGYDPALLAMTERGMKIYCLSFLPTGVNIFGSAFFTALNNGAVSAAISFLRTLLFQVAAVLALPVLMELDGIWLSIIAAEGMALCVTVLFFVKMRPRYQY